jgi:hypothetical protein
MPSRGGDILGVHSPRNGHTLGPLSNVSDTGRRSPEPLFNMQRSLPFFPSALVSRVPLESSNKPVSQASAKSGGPALGCTLASYRETMSRGLLDDRHDLSPSFPHLSLPSPLPLLP